MDIGEIMKFKPVTAPKRPGDAHEEPDEEIADDPNDNYEKRAAKRRKRQKAEQRRMEGERLALLEAEAAQILTKKDASDGLSEDQRTKIKALVDDAEESSEVLDETALKKLILAFEKKALRNQELRIKFPEEPKKFMESEVELHGAIQDLRAMATAPDLYPLVVELQCVPSFLGLLSHENTDISVGVVDLLQELTDVDTLTESAEGASALVDALMDHQISALLVQNLDRLDDHVREESDGIHNTLSIFENLIEIRPEICEEATEHGLLSWLVKRLKVKTAFDDNKLYASEILSIFLQNAPANRQKYGELGAIDSLLQQLAYYKRHNPGTPEEQEMMENLFDCLCSLLLFMPNRERFLKGEGLQLMNLMLRERKVSRNGALKVLDHALIGAEGKDCCAKFVDILGLRTIFPLFMKTPKKNKRKGVSAEEHEEHVISIVASLMKNCRGPQRTRLLVKFTESDHEKVERLMELHFKYWDKMDQAERKIKRLQLDEDEAYLKRLDLGLFSLQLVDYIIVEACASGAPTVKQRTLQILNQRSGTVQDIRNVVREYAGNLGDPDDSAETTEEREGERQHLLHLVDKF